MDLPSTSYVFPTCRQDFLDIHLKTDFIIYLSERFLSKTWFFCDIINILCSLPPRLSQVNLQETFQTISSWWDLKINKPLNILVNCNCNALSAKMSKKYKIVRRWRRGWTESQVENLKNLAATLRRRKNIFL